MDGAPPHREQAAILQIRFAKCCSCQANCHSQGIGKTMVKEALKISAAAVASDSFL